VIDAARGTSFPLQERWLYFIFRLHEKYAYSHHDRLLAPTALARWSMKCGKCAKRIFHTSYSIFCAAKPREYPQREGEVAENQTRPNLSSGRAQGENLLHIHYNLFINTSFYTLETYDIIIVVIANQEQQDLFSLCMRRGK